MVKERAVAKFDETIEVALNLGVDPRHADQMVRGVANLPNGSGRTARVAVFARGDRAEEAKKAGADIVGAEDLVETVQKGEINFDRCIATPDMMPLVGRLGKVLGPRGLMPNPKVGTVTNDVTQAVKRRQGRRRRVPRREGGHRACRRRQGVVHRGGADARTSAPSPTRCSKAKPSGAKGTYMKRIALSLDAGAQACASIRPRFQRAEVARVSSGQATPGARVSLRAAQAVRAKSGRQVRLSGRILSETAGELRLLSP